MNVWRLQTKTSKGRISDYCLNNHVAAVGWSLIEIPDFERITIRTFDAYLSYAEIQYDNFDSVKRMYYDVQVGDLIWIRDGGKYYIGRVGENSKWEFNVSPEALAVDASNQLTNIVWYWFNESDESTIPGAINTAFIKGSTFQRINKSGVQEYSALLYDQLANSGFYKNIKLSLSQSNFYSLLSPEDCEDLLCLWLYKKYGYICIPSTNKISTPLYECVLIDPNNGAHIYIQVKKGTVDINADDYAGLDGAVWFLTTDGKVKNADTNVHSNMYAADSTELFEFALSEESDNIMSPSIKTWARFLTEQDNKRLATDSKGIMFDTNKTYSSDDERTMLECRKISAFGNAKRYIKSFNQGDYVLYYSRGKGIIAIGKISSSKPIENGNELYHNVEPIIFPEMIGQNENLPAISPAEIKSILNRGFYFASTIKTPFISVDETEKLIVALKDKYQK